MNRLPTVSRVLLSTAVLVACAVTIFAGGAAAASIAAASAALPANAKAEISSVPSSQLVYTGLDGPNRVTLSSLADG